MVMTARHLAKRAPSLWYSARRSRRPSRPSVTVSILACGPASGLAPRVDLDAGDRTGGLHDVDQRRAVLGLLADRLVIEDDAGDVVLHALAGAEQHLAIVAARVLGRGDADGVEALLDRAGAFVGSKDAFAGGNERLGDFRKLFSHGQPLVVEGTKFAAEHLAPNRRRGQPQGPDCGLSPPRAGMHKWRRHGPGKKAVNCGR